MEAILTPPATPTLPAISPRARWIGRILSYLPVLFLLFDAAIKLADIAPVREASARLGLPPSLSLPIALIELTGIALYLVPRTAVLGAVLLTGFLGGAVAIHARLGDPLFTHTLFPIYVAILFWSGLALRDPRVRALARDLV